MIKMRTGIPGLDAITNGGLPSGRITLVTGDTGAGKTILSLQTLVRGAEEFGEPGVLVSFEEHADEIASSAASFGWHLVPWSTLNSSRSPPGTVPVIEANLTSNTVQAGDFDLSGLLAGLTAAVQRTAAKRIVFDGIDVLLDLLDDPRQRRSEIARIDEWTRATGVTSIITGKQLDDTSPQEGYGFLRYIVSCVIALKRSPQEAGSTERTARVLKMRGSGHSSSHHPMIIRDTGIIIGDVGSNRLLYEAPREHVSSSVDRLDAMLGGGYYKASGILISGAPGTAKSTLSGAFVDAACCRGERALLISFDEAFTQIERNLASVNIHLQPHAESGLLATAGFRTGRLSGEEHYHQIMELVEAHRPAALVIDPISALDKVVGHELAGDLAERLIDEAKVRGITVLMTALLESASGIQERARIQISSIADTWIHLSFAIVGGERNRALTIIKSRGNAHSNQVRELMLSHEGLGLSDVYAQHGSVLMGTARLEREQLDQVDEEQRRGDAELARQEIDNAEARLNLRMQQVEVELSALKRRRETMTRIKAAREGTREADHLQVMKGREAQSTNALLPEDEA